MKHTQGAWDPNARGLYFAAGDLARFDTFELAARYNQRNSNLFAVNDFASPGGRVDRDSARFKQFLISIDHGCPTLLDSGIFNLTADHARTHNISQHEAFGLPPDDIDNFQWLWDVYLELCTEFKDQLWGFVELDLGGATIKTQTRARLEAEGLVPIPVYHPLNDTWGYFDDLASAYDRICFSRSAVTSRWASLRMMMTLTERHRQYPDLYVHILGLTPSDVQAGLPFDSADSSSWTAALRWPQGVNLYAMGAKAAPLDPNYYLPSAEHCTDVDEARQLRGKAGDMAIVNSVANQLSLGHWHTEVADQLGVQGYTFDF